MNRTLFLATVVALALGIAMTVLSAHIRLSDSGIDCSPWPECFAHSYKTDDQPGISIHQADPNKGMRMFHRTLASLFGLLVLFQFSLAAWHRKTLGSGLLLPGVILVLTLLLALVGMNTPDLVHPIVTLINLAGGMALSACLYWYLLDFYPTFSGRPLTLVTLTTVALAILSGAWVSGNFAAGVCETICFVEGGSWTAAFDPGRALALTASGIQIDEQQRIILLGHQILGLGAIVLLICNVLLLRPIALALAMLLAPFSLSIIVALEHLDRSVWLASAHNGLSLVILLLLIHQYRRWDRR